MNSKSSSSASSEHHHVGRAAGVVGAMTLLSRVFGFLRDLVIAMKFGTSMSADAFFVAFRIPNMQRRVLGEGAVNAAFIPVFSELLNQKGENAAWKMTGILFNIFIFLLLALTLFMMVFAPQIIMLFAPGFTDEPAKFELTVTLTRWMSPYLLFIGLAALCMGILNVYKVFALPAVAPVLLNISMILATLYLAPQMDDPIMGLAIGVLIGGVLQLLIQLPETCRKGFHFVRSINWRDPEVMKISKLMVPVIFGLAVYEINLMVDTLLASLLQGGSVSYLYYGNRLVQLPLGIFAVALSVAILPTLSGQAARGNIAELVKTIGFGIRFILFITLPATVALIILRFPIINTLWERGEFQREATEGTAIALLYYAVGLCAFAGVKVITPAYYSLQDTRTPVKIGAFTMVLNIILNLLLMGPLAHGGLALATSIAALCNAYLLIHFLRKRLGLMGGRKLFVSTLKMIFCSALMGLLLHFLSSACFVPEDALAMRLLVLTGCIIAGGASYALLARLLKLEEWTFLIELIRKRREKY